MNHRYLVHAGIVILTLSVLLLLANAFRTDASGVFALLNAGYDFARWTVDGGGGSSTGGNYSIAGTIGQPDAGMLHGSSYTLEGGFWGGWTLSRHMFLPLIAR